jgi:hypothetical protein
MAAIELVERAAPLAGSKGNCGIERRSFSAFVAVPE